MTTTKITTEIKPTSTTKTSLEAQLVRYENPACGFAISYPRGWVLQDRGEHRTSTALTSPTVTSLPMSFYLEDTCLIYLDVIPASEGVTPADLQRAAVSLITNPAFTLLQESLLDQGEMTLAGRPALYVRSHMGGYNSCESLDIWVNTETQVYTVGVSVYDPHRYADWAPLIQRVLDSFALT